MVQETRIRKSGHGESSPRYLLFLVLVMTLMIALLECLSYTSLYSKDTVIGDTFGLVLGRDPLWSKRPIRKLKLLEWLTESWTVFFALQ